MQLLQSASKSPAARRCRPSAAVDCARAVLNVTPPVIRAIRGMMRSRHLAELSVPQFRALVLLSRNPCVSLSVVADYIGSSLPAASRMIDGLVTRQFVQRNRGGGDRRCVSLELTAHGRAVIDDAYSASEQQLAVQLGGLSAAEHQAVMDGLDLLARVFGTDADFVNRWLKKSAVACQPPATR